VVAAYLTESAAEAADRDAVHAAVGRAVTAAVEGRAGIAPARQ
jgi:hypothetical protein